MVRATVRIPTPLRGMAGGVTEVSVDAATVGEAIETACAAHPALRRHLLSASGTLHAFVSVYLNDDDIRNREREATSLREGDVISIVPAIAGGSPSPRKNPRTRSRARRRPAVGPLPNEALHRYSRHLILPEVGVAGQRRLREARVLLVGAGGLGSPAALYLAAAGVGTLGLAEFDTVDLSNLQRQVLYTTDDVGQAKSDAARRRLRALNPDVRVVLHRGRLAAGNARRIVRSYDVVLDGSDNFPTRYLVNDACVLERRPDVYGSIFRFEGQVSVFDARRGPCYRCLYPEPPPPELVPSCAEAGVLGVLPGLVGTLQATEAVKLILGVGRPLIGRLLLYDALGPTFRELALRKSPRCAVCSAGAPITQLIDYEAFCGSPAPGIAPEITPEELAKELSSADPPLLVDVRAPGERVISHLPGARAILPADFSRHLSDLGRANAVVVFCRSGTRSAQAARTLIDLGLSNVRSLRGGINAWAERIDPTLPIY